MEHAKKVFLVENPVSQAEGLNSQLDKTVGEILAKRGISDDKKLALYHDALLRYQTAMTGASRPLRVTIPHDTGSVLGRYPESERERVKFALERIKQSPSLNWNEDGELTHRGEPIAGSNIKDLLDLFLSEQRGVPGWNVFSDAVKNPRKPAIVRRKTDKVDAKKESPQKTEAPKKRSQRQRRQPIRWDPY